jgi:Phage-related minor tail protein
VPEVANLQVVVSADTTQLDRGLADANKSVTGLGSSIQSALGTAAVGAVVGLGAAFVGSVKSAADFEKQMSAIGAVSGATQTEMDALTQTALQLGKDTSFSAKEAAAGMEELAKAGVSTADIIGGAGRAALDLAAAGAVGVADAAEIASNALNVFNLSGADMAHVADQIAGAANASAIGVNDYKFSLSAAGAVAATVGVSFEDLTTSIAAMGNAGIKGSDAGTSLKTMLLNLQPTTLANYKAFNELGLLTYDAQAAMELLRSRGIEPVMDGSKDLTTQIQEQILGIKDVTKMSDAQKQAFNKLATETGIFKNEMFDATGSVKGMEQIAGLLHERTQGMTDAQKLMTLEMAFGSDAIRAAAVMAETGAEGFAELAAQIGKVSAQQVAEERLNNLWGSLEKLKGSLETGAIMLGSIFLPALKTMVDGLTVYVNQGIEIIEKLPAAWADMVTIFTEKSTAGAFEELLANLGLTEPAVIAVSEAVAALGDAYRTALPVLQSVATFLIDTIGPALQAVGAFIAEHPELIAGLVAAWASFVVITTVIGWIGAAITAFGALSLAITQAGGVIALIVGVLGGPLTLAILAIVAVIGLLTAAWVGNWFDIQGKTAAAVAAITPLIQNMLMAIEGFWTAHGERIMTIVEAIWTIVTTGATNAFTALAAIFTAGLQLLSGDWAGAWTTMTTAAQAIWDGWLVQLGAVLTILVALFGPAFEQIAAAWTTLMTTVQGIWDAGWAAIQAALMAAWNLLSTENQTRITELITLMTELWTTVQELWTTGTTALTTLMTTWWATTLTDWTTAQTAISDTVGPWWQTIQELWTTALAAISEALGAAWANIVTATAGMFERIGAEFSNAMTSLGQAATALGTAIMDALVAAVNQKVQELVSSVTGAVQSALDAARRLLGGGKGAALPGGGPDEPAAYLRQAALARGIDPEQVARVMQAEGPGGWGAVGTFPTGTSYGPLQLHYAGGTQPTAGMGDVFTQLTGIDLRINQSIEAHKAAIDFALDRLSETGDYREWYGADPALGSRFTAVSRVTPQVPSGVIAAQQRMVPQIGQMGLVGGTLTATEAAAFCGPAAAMWFANIYGRMPTTAEAEAMARQVGWTPEYGMQGPASQQALLSAMGVAANLDVTPTPGEVGALAAQNVPFQLSTAAHYFQVQGGTLAGLNVGASGTALAGGAPVMSLDQIIALSGAMNGIITLAPQMGAALATASATGGAALQGLLVSATTLADGSTVAITDMNGQITTSIISATGQVTATYGQMTTAVTEQSSMMATGVGTSFGTMSTITNQVVTDMGVAVMTMTTDTAGNVITTVTDMQGQVIAQYATLASGATVTMGDMAAGVTTTTQAMGETIATTVTDMSGNVVTTVTDMSGNVAEQYVTLAGETTATAAEMGAEVTAVTAEMGATVVEETAAMSTEVAATAAEMGAEVTATTAEMGAEVVDETAAMGDGVLSVTADMAGNYVSTVSDMAGNVISEYSSMSSDVVGTTEEMANTVVETFGEAGSDIADAVSEWGESVTDGLGDVADDAASAAEEIGQSISEGIASGIEDGAGDVADAVRDVVEEAIDEAKDEAEAESPSKLFARELGVPIAQGVAAGIAAASGSVYDATRDLISVPPAPRGEGRGAWGEGGMETLRVEIAIGGRVAEEIYVTGRQLALRRGRRPAEVIA